jgi:HK97 family phage prohead protease
MRETRIFAAPVEVRGTTDGSATISGYGAVFDTDYEVLGFMESVAPGAFDKSLKERYDDLAVLADHDPARVLGTTASGTARLSVDQRGLYYEADLDLLDPDGISTFRKVSTGKVRQSSFAFEVIKDEWTHPEDTRELPHRTLREVRLWEASPVLWGANPATQVDLKRAARSLAIAYETDATIIETAITEGRLVAALADTNATEEPEAEPQEHSESTQQPEPIKYPF